MLRFNVRHQSLSRIDGFSPAVKINPTLSVGSASQEPTPTVYEQLLEKLSHVDGGKFTDWGE